MPYCQAKENDANTKRYSLRERTNLALTSSPSLQNTSKNKPNVSGRKPSLRSAPARKKPCIGPCCAKQTATKSTKKTNPATRSPVRNVSRKLDLNPGVLTKRCSVRLNRLPHGEDKPTRTCVYSTEQTGPEESLKDPHCEDKSALYEFKVDGDEKSTSKNVVKKPKRGRKGHDSDASDSEYLPSRFDPRRYKRSIAVLTRTRDKNKSNNQNTIVNDGESSEMNLSENLVVKDTDGSLSTSFNPTEDSNLSLIHLSTDTSVQSEAPSFFTRSNRSNVSPVKNLSTLTTPDKCDNSNKENIINIPPLTSTFSDRKIKRFGRRTAYLSPSDVTNINLVLEDSFDSPPSKVPFKTQGTGTKLSETLHKYNQILKSSANTPPNSRLEVPQKAVHFSLDSSLGTLASRVTFIENSPKSPVNAHHTNKIAVKNSSQQTPGINRQSGPLIKTSSTRSLGETLNRKLKPLTESCLNITSPRNPEQEVKAIDRSCSNITSPRNPEQEVKAIDRSCPNITSPRNPEQEVKAIDRSCPNITSPRNRKQEVKAIDRSCSNITSPRDRKQEDESVERSCPLRLSVGMTHSYSKSEGPGLDSLFGFDQDDLEEELLSPVKLSSETKRPQVKFAVCSTPDSGKTTHKNGVLPWRPAVNSAPAARPRSRAGNNSSSSHSETISLCDAAESRTTDSSKTLEGRTLPQRPAVDSATSVRQRNRARKNSSSSSHSNTVSLCDRTECPPLLSDPAESHSSLVGDTSVTKRRQPVQSTMDMYLSSTCPPDKSPQHESKSMTKQKTDLVSCNPHIYDEDPNIPVVFNKPPRHSYERKQRGKRCMSEERWEETAQLAEEQHESSKQRRKRTKKHVEEDKKIEDLCASLNSKFKEVEDFELCVE
uniref:Uncharacterized protein n=1 Tax=Timema douglasi TaxID=61478 RepID=A0A7R8VJQ6_TIMDO|nr:unnamed protein product [Timema douglasi]